MKGKDLQVYTISKLAKHHGLSRSTLLYYDSIGLLRPNGRASNGYRRYSEKDSDRLSMICLYRRAGLPLRDIRRVLDGGASELETALTRRLQRLNEEIEELREQQRLILGVLKAKPHAGSARFDKSSWASLLAASGFSADDMMQWHAVFERRAPADHQRFLEFLHIPPDEIAGIRERSRKGWKGRG